MLALLPKPPKPPLLLLALLPLPLPFFELLPLPLLLLPDDDEWLWRESLEGWRACLLGRAVLTTSIWTRGRGRSSTMTGR